MRRWRSRTSIATCTWARRCVPAILDGAQQIAVPAFVSTLAHLHRVPADVLPRRRGALPVRAAGRSRGLRDARLVFLVADDRPDAGEISPGSRERMASAPSSNPFARIQQAFERGFQRVSGVYGSMLGAAVHRRAGLHPRLPGRLRVERRCWCRGWARTSSRPPTAASSSSTCGPRPAPGSRKRRGCATGRGASSGEPFRPAKPTTSSTTSACRAAR